MAHLYKGKDRRMILKTKKVLETIIRRDQRTLDPRPTTSLSTRLPILDYDDTEGGLLWAAQLIVQQMIDDLAELPQARAEKKEELQVSSDKGVPSPENPQ